MARRGRCAYTAVSVLCAPSVSAGSHLVRYKKMNTHVLTVCVDAWSAKAVFAHYILQPGTATMSTVAAWALAVAMRVWVTNSGL